MNTSQKQLYMKQWREKNKEKITIYQQQYSKKNKDILQEKAKERYQENPEKYVIANRKWREKNREKIRIKDKIRKSRPEIKLKNRNYNLMKYYGVTLEEWNNLFTKQGECCAICKSPTTNGTGWHTDHDHKKGKVRGILCSPCNIAIGHFKDNIEALESAIIYLSENNS